MGICLLKCPKESESEILFVCLSWIVAVLQTPAEPHVMLKTLRYELFLSHHKKIRVRNTTWRTIEFLCAPCLETIVSLIKFN